MNRVLDRAIGTEYRQLTETMAAAIQSMKSALAAVIVVCLLTLAFVIGKA